MKRGTRKAVSILIAIIILILLVFILLQGPKLILTGGTVTSLENESASYNIGDEVQVNLTIYDVTNLSGIQINVSFDSSRLSYKNTTEGEFLSENDSVSTYFNESEIDTATAGQLNNIIISRLGEEDGATGNGTLASIYFNATGSGMAFVRITSALLSNNTGGAISSTIQNTTVNISGEGGGGG